MSPSTAGGPREGIRSSRPMGEGSERGEERREKGRDGEGGGEENDEWTPETQPAVAAEQARGGVDGGRWVRDGDDVPATVAVAVAVAVEAPVAAAAATTA
jgi:hypothetical protein